MSGATHLRLRKHLASPHPPPLWPSDIQPSPFSAVEPGRIHALLETAFPGLIAPCSDWYGNLTTDSEFDAALCIAALASSGEVVGFVQSWMSSFIKDLAVSPAHRGRGLGEALLRHTFMLFAARGAEHVDLKVESDNTPALRLYARLGMVEVDA